MTVPAMEDPSWRDHFVQAHMVKVFIVQDGKTYRVLNSILANSLCWVFHERKEGTHRALRSKMIGGALKSGLIERLALESKNLLLRWAWLSVAWLKCFPATCPSLLRRLFYFFILVKISPGVCSSLPLPRLTAYQQNWSILFSCQASKIVFSPQVKSTVVTI